MVKPETSKHSGATGTRTVAVLMFLLWLGTFALVVSPQLHELFHKDAHCSTHNCLVTHVQKQSLLTGLAPVISVSSAPAVLCKSVEQHDFLPLLSYDYRLIPGRGPPSLQSIHCA